MTGSQKSSDKILSRIFFSMLPVQILIFAMGSINTLIDGAMAGQFVGSDAIGIIGLYYSMVNVMNAVGSVLLGGTAVLCGGYMGKGELKKTEGVFSLNLTVTLLVGAVLTFVSVITPGPIATILGASEDLKAGLVQYIMGYAIGIIPMLLAQQIAAFLQMERQSLRGYIGIAGMIVSNIVFDVVFVAVLHMGIWGLALATSFSNIVYCLILLPYYLSPKAGLHYGIKKILWPDLGPMCKIGFPGAMLVFCLAIRGIVINRVLLHYSGNDGLSAMSSFNMVSGFFIAYCLGNGAVVRILISIFGGEEDRSSMKKVMRIVYTKGMLLSLGIAAIVFVISPLLTRVFFPDPSTNVYHLAYQLFVIYAFCIPLVLLCQIFTNYLQATSHTLFVNIQSVFDGFFSMVIPALILAPFMGALGVWLANPIGIILTILTVPIYGIIRCKRLPRGVDEWMLLKPGFGVTDENYLDLSITSTEDVAKASATIQEFCDAHGMGKSEAIYTALCLEEMAGNVVAHGFTADKKKHVVSALAAFKEDHILLRIKDDCIPFNPVEMRDLVTDENSFENIGIRTVLKIADDVTYQSLLGLNVLTVLVREKDLLQNVDTDYLMEKRLRELDPALHRRFRDTVLVIGNLLAGYKTLFPEYTDHSELHSMTVIDSCNRLIAKEQIEKMNADEIYILLVSCYLHDVGMGIGEKDYQEFKDAFDEKGFFEKHPGSTKADFVRTYHNEFSGLFVQKYADLFDIPSPEHVFAIRQIVRGHRKTDLYNETEYPAALQLSNGNTVCLPYLAALIRLSDEVDVVATRNPLVLYDIETLTDEVEIVENKKLEAIKRMRMTVAAFILTCQTTDEDIYRELVDMAGKMQKTLDYCADVVKTRTPYTISQKKVILRRQ